jgi:hypothetical protein
VFERGGESHFRRRNDGFRHTGRIAPTSATAQLKVNSEGKRHSG